MCGRAVQISSQEKLQLELRLGRVNTEVTPRYNLAPTQKISGVVNQDGEISLESYRWGLVPSWADDPSIGNRMINARAEGIAEKPSFRSAFRHRHCLVPIDGFYEWLKDGKQKIPFYFRDPEEHVLSLAGLWEVWEKGEEPLHTLTIVTTEANTQMSRIHNRMPVILSPEDREPWLDPDADPEFLKTLLHPYEEKMEEYPVSKRVNSPANEGPELIEPDEENAKTMTILDIFTENQTPNSF